MIPYGKHHLDEDDIQAVVDVLRSGALTQGPLVEVFEHIIADYVGARYAVAVSSGTAALHLAALVAGVKPGSSLITSPITFVASANAGLYAGGKVTFADVDSESINISPSALKAALKSNPSIKAVVPVHFAGLVCDMTAIKTLADEAEAVIIEDAAHALGASYSDGQRVGCCAHSLMTIFSFHPVKAIAAGEGGMITTNDEGIYRELLRLRSHGINKLDDIFLNKEYALTNGKKNLWYYEMQQLGFHYRITDIQCALAISQMKKLDAFQAHRRKLVARYDEFFALEGNIKPAQLADKSRSGNHIYPVRIDFNRVGKSRNEVMSLLRAEGVGTQVHYIPVPMHPLYLSLGENPANYPNALNYYNEALTIPVFYDLSFEQQDYVINALNKALT